MTYVDSVMLNLIEWSCRKFQVLTGRTNVWLAVQATNLSIIVYFVWTALYFWHSDVGTRVLVGLFCSGVLYVLTQTIFKESIEAYENSAYRRVANGFSNPRRVRDALLRIAFLTLSSVLSYPAVLVYFNLHQPIVLLTYSLVVLTTIVLYLLACDPLPPCAAKLTEWFRRLAASRLAASDSPHLHGMLDMKLTMPLLVAAIASIALHGAAAQSPERLDLTDVGKNPRWKIAGRTASIVDMKGKRALKLSEAPGMGVVWLDGYTFANGTIELDMLGRSQPVQGSFVGAAFRVADADTHDAVYFRPFNFRASDPDRHSHAVQYASHPQWPWQKLRAERPGKYERAVTPEPDGDEWFHVRLVVERPKVTVFVNQGTEPCLVVDELSDRARGSVGLWVGEGSGGYFANLQVTRKP